MNLDDIRPRPYPSPEQDERHRVRQRKRIEALRILGIDAEAPGGRDFTGIRLSASEADKLIRLLRRRPLAPTR